MPAHVAKPSWRDESACPDAQWTPADGEEQEIDFFTDDPTEKYAARAVCMSKCPVRWDCLKYALDNKEIWGIWGGVDEYEIRRSLSVDRLGDPIRRARAPRCPFCSRPTLETKIKKRARYFVECTVCGLSWWIRRAPRATPAPPASVNET